MAEFKHLFRMAPHGERQAWQRPSTVFVQVEPQQPYGGNRALEVLQENTVPWMAYMYATPIGLEGEQDDHPLHRREVDEEYLREPLALSDGGSTSLDEIETSYIRVKIPFAGNDQLFMTFGEEHVGSTIVHIEDGIRKSLQHLKDDTYGTGVGSFHWTSFQTTYGPEARNRGWLGMTIAVPGIVRVSGAETLFRRRPCGILTAARHIEEYLQQDLYARAYENFEELYGN